MKVVIPFPQPDDEDLTTITKFVEYVTRNGESFELKVKSKEQDNPQFSFLYPHLKELSHGYYKWCLYCSRRGMSDEIRIKKEDEIANKILCAPLGTIELIDDDKELLQSLLVQNTGSKDSIKSIRKWILERSHSLWSILHKMYEFTRSITSPSSTELSLQSVADKSKKDISNFSKCLQIVYVLNDLLFNGATANLFGPYTRIVPNAVGTPIPVLQIILPFLPWLLQTTYRVASTETEKERVLKMIYIWLSKGFIDASTSERLSNVTVHTSDAPIPPLVPLICPFPSETDSHSGLPSSLYLPESAFKSNAAVLAASSTVLNNSGLNMPPNLIVPTPFFPMPPRPILTTGMPLPPPIFNPIGVPVPNNIQFFMPPQMQMPATGPLMLGKTVAPVLPPVLDLHRCSVGTMSNIVKAAIKSGHPRYLPVDVRALSQSAQPHIEPGRLSARVAEFYRKTESILNVSNNVSLTPDRAVGHERIREIR